MHIMRIATVYEPDIKELPDEFRKVLTKDDVSLIEQGPEFLKSLTKPKSPKWLAKLLTECSKSHFELHFQAANQEPYRPYFQFMWGGEPYISLPRGKPLRKDMPPFLQDIFQTIGAFRESGFTMAGGLYAGDELVPISELPIWIGEEAPEAYTAAIPFIETLSGRMLCYLAGDGGGVWYEEGQLNPVKNLEKEVARYFEALLKGTRI